MPAESIVSFVHTKTPFRAKTIFEAFLIFKAIANAEGLGASIVFDKPKLHRCELNPRIPRRNLRVRYVEIVAPNPVLEETMKILRPR